MKKNITNKELKELLEWIEEGNPIKDRWDECDLISQLAEDLANERKIDLKKLNYTI